MSFEEATLQTQFQRRGMRSHEGVSEYTLRALLLAPRRDHKGQGLVLSTAELLNQQLSLRKRQQLSASGNLAPNKRHETSSPPTPDALHHCTFFFFSLLSCHSFHFRYLGAWLPCLPSADLIVRVTLQEQLDLQTKVRLFQGMCITSPLRMKDELKAHTPTQESLAPHSEQERAIHRQPLSPPAVPL